MDNLKGNNTLSLIHIYKRIDTKPFQAHLEIETIYIFKTHTLCTKSEHCILNYFKTNWAMNDNHQFIKKKIRDDDDNSLDIRNMSIIPNKSRKTFPAKVTKFGRYISSKYRRIASMRKINYSKMVVNTDGILHIEILGSELSWKRKRIVSYPPLERKILAMGFSPSDINENTSCIVLYVNALDIE